jgi:ABC-type transporter Mla subunit MlaD
MALQDLTPQLRTRLSRMERAVGWFVMLAVGLLVFGFVYYLYTTAERKGWFKTKAPYFTFADRATGLKVGDPVQLMGFDVGQITRIDAQPPEDQYNVYVEFEVKDPYPGYLWTDSRAKVMTADLLGKRVLEVTKGIAGYPTYIFHPLRRVSLAEARDLPEAPKWVLGEEVFQPNSTNILAKPFAGILTNLPALQAAELTSVIVLDTREKRKAITGYWQDKEGRYDVFGPNTRYWLLSEETAAVTERLEKLIGDVEQALPNILALTNQLAQVLSNSTALTSNLNAVAVSAQPLAQHLAELTAHLDRPGALGELLIPTNLNQKLDITLGTASRALTRADATLELANTNLAVLAENLNRSLENLAALTGNLNQQVAANSNLVSGVSEAIAHADQFVQGLKRHWLFRSAFKKKEAPRREPEKTQATQPLRAPKEK